MTETQRPTSGGVTAPGGVQPPAEKTMTSVGTSTTSSESGGDLGQLRQRVHEARANLQNAEEAYARAGGARETTAQEDEAARARAAQAAGSTPLVVSGRPGGPFTILGGGFGTATGQVIISGRLVEVTSWRDHSIKGTLPADVQAGEVVVQSSYGRQTAKWPPTPASAEALANPGQGPSGSAGPVVAPKQ